MKRLTAWLLLLCISGSLFPGCEAKKKDGSFAKEETTTITSVATESESTSEVLTSSEQIESDIKTTEESEVLSSETTSQVSDASSDTDQAIAVELAGKHGLSEAVLKGQYDLFLKFSETVEGNSSMGDYKEFVYLIFPVVASNAEYIDDDYFFQMLGSLEITSGEIPHDGTYDVCNLVTISEKTINENREVLPRVLFHELMHFLDWTMNGMKTDVYTKGDQHLTPADIVFFTAEESADLIACEGSWIVTEGGAEYMTAKYFTGAPCAYMDCVAFLTGIEYIMGEEYMDRLFFSWDTDALFQELFLEAGYTLEQYIAASRTMNSTARPDLEDYPDDPVSLDDLLIDLYTHYKGGNWKEDKGFLAIIKNFNGIGLQGWRRSKNADFIGTIVYQSFDQFESLEKAFIEDIPENPVLDQMYPTIFMRDGKLYHGSMAELTNPRTGEKYRGYVIYEWDYETDRRIDYQIRSVKPFVEKYF